MLSSIDGRTEIDMGELVDILERAMSDISRVRGCLLAKEQEKNTAILIDWKVLRKFTGKISIYYGNGLFGGFSILPDGKIIPFHLTDSNKTIASIVHPISEIIVVFGMKNKKPVVYWSSRRPYGEENKKAFISLWNTGVV